MKHWHLKGISYKRVTHSHDGGDKYHEHRNMKGYGKKKTTIKLRVRSQKSLNNVPSELVKYAVVTRTVTALFP